MLNFPTALLCLHLSQWVKDIALLPPPAFWLFNLEMPAKKTGGYGNPDLCSSTKTLVCSFPGDGCCPPTVTRWQSRTVLYSTPIFHGCSHAASTDDDGYHWSDLLLKAGGSILCYACLPPSPHKLCVWFQVANVDSEVHRRSILAVEVQQSGWWCSVLQAVQLRDVNISTTVITFSRSYLLMQVLPWSCARCTFV